MPAINCILIGRREYCKEGSSIHMILKEFMSEGNPTYNYIIACYGMGIPHEIRSPQPVGIKLR